MFLGTFSERAVYLKLTKLSFVNYNEEQTK